MHIQYFIIFTFWIFFGLLLETTFLRDFPSIHIGLDLLFYPVIILGLYFKPLSSFIITFILAYILDAISYAPYGTHIISFLLTLVLIRKVKGNIYIESRLSLFVWILIFSVLKQFIQYAYLKLIMGGAGYGGVDYLYIFLQSLWDAVFGLVFIPVLTKLLFKNWIDYFRKPGIRD